MFRKLNRLGYKREIVVNERGEPELRRNCRGFTRLVKDLKWAGSMEALRSELHL